MSRVTMGMMNDQLLFNLQSNLSRLLKYQRQLATGRAYERVSENPTGAVKELSLRTELTQNSQYRANLADATAWMQYSDSSMDQILSVSQRVRELAVYAGSAALNRDDLAALAEEVRRLRDEVLQVANAQFGGRHIFAGTRTDVRPFEVDPSGKVVYRGSDERLKVEIEPKEVVSYSVTGRDLFAESFVRHRVVSRPVEQDFVWRGRSHVLLFRVGDRIAKVRIPEGYLDDDGDNVLEPSDGNMHRDPGEVKGLSLREIAEIIKRELSMGEVGKLLDVRLELDPTSGLQRLVFESRTSTPFQIVPLRDPEARRDLVGRYVSPSFRASSSETLTLLVDGTSYALNVLAGDDLYAISRRANELLSGLGVFFRVEEGPSGEQRLLVQVEGGRSLSVSGTSGGLVDQLGIRVSGFRSDASDVDHVGLSELLGISTRISSFSFDPSSTFDFSSTPLHLKIWSPSGEGSVFLDGNSVALSDVAEAIRRACGDFVQVVLETDGGDPGVGQNAERVSSRILLYSRDGSPLVVYDYADGGSWSNVLGIGTALASPPLPASFSSSSELEPVPGCRLPEKLLVGIGDELFEVLVPHGSSLQAVGSAVVSAIGPSRVGFEVQDLPGGDRRLVLFSREGLPVRVFDGEFSDPRFKGYSGDLAYQLGFQMGVTSSSVLDNQTLSSGAFRIAALGRSVDVVVRPGDTLKDLADRIRDLAPWLVVSYRDEDPGSPGSQANLSVAALDGSPIWIYDLTSSFTASSLGLSTAIQGNNASTWTNGPNDWIEISAGGTVHRIDLSGAGAGSLTVDDVANLVNARFGGKGVVAEVVEVGPNDRRLFLYSPRGFRIGVVENLSVSLGINVGSVSASYNQLVGQSSAPSRAKVDYFEVLRSLSSAMEAEDRDGISSILGEIDQFIEALLHQRAKVGAQVKRFEMTSSRLSSDEVDLTELLSKVADVDMAEIITQLKMAEAVYQASLAVGSRVMLPTLVDYMK